MADLVARRVEAFMPKPDPKLVAGRPHHLDATVLSTPSLAISCAAAPSRSARRSDHRRSASASDSCRAAATACCSSRRRRPMRA